MLEDPGLLRQWVLRRLQRAYMIDLWGASFRHGMARGSAVPGGEVGRFARAADERARDVEELIRDLGSVPYRQLGVVRRLCYVAGRLLGLGGAALAHPALRRLSAFTASEYNALVGLADEAPGLPPGLADRLDALLSKARSEVDWAS